MLSKLGQNPNSKEKGDHTVDSDLRKLSRILGHQLRSVENVFEHSRGHILY